MENTDALIKSGKTDLRMVVIAMIGIVVLNLGISSFAFPSLPPILSLSATLCVTILIVYFLGKGRIGKWSLFAWLMLLALEYFFVGGQRMTFKGQDGGLTAMASVLMGLINIGLAVYLGGSDPIAAYLKSKSPDEEES